MSERVPSSTPRIVRFREWLRDERGLAFADYEALRRWSTDDLAAFWRSIWGYAELESPTAFETVVEGAMPNARWFRGAEVNYARQVLRHADLAEAAGQPAIMAADERGHPIEIGWRELRRRTASLAIELQERGIRRGDRVAAYLPNIPEAVVAMLACASLGAIWTLCSTDMGTSAVLDRFRQTQPKALIAVDGVFYAGKRRDRSAAVAELRRGLPSVEALLVIGTGHGDARISGAIDFAVAEGRDDGATAAFEPEWLPFDHPLWILYSSGTTGLPKAIVHGHGGVIVGCCVGNLHLDLGPSYDPNHCGERFQWFTASGWVMWNIQVGALLGGTTICLYNGSPRGPGGDSDWTPLWRFAAASRVTWFGAGAAFHASCRRANTTLADIGDLSAIRALGSTGSPLPAEVQEWGTAQFAAIGNPDVWWCNISGGTDIVVAFLSGNRELPPTPGRLQCRQLGAAVEARDEDGQPVWAEVGELVCTRPFPSMPLCFWGDEDGSRYRATYFDTWPGIWRHGDWLTIEADGSCTISGRSDATINRQGVRMGTADIYNALDGLAQIADSLVIDVEDGAGGSTLIMFVVTDKAAEAAGLEAAIGEAIRATLSPRFVPDLVVRAPAIPRTLSGKKQELPVKRLFQGWPVERVLNPDLIENPQVIPWYVEQADAWRAATRSLEGVAS